MIIEGSISVKACIEANKREIIELYIQKDKKTKDFNYIRKIAKNKNIKINELSKEELSSFLIGKSHGGIGANVKERKEDSLEKLNDIFFIDGIEDPFNLGYIFRNLYAFGFKDIIIPRRDFNNMEAQLLKSSAGAYEKINLYFSDDNIKTINELKEDGYKTYALFRGDNSKDIFEISFSNKNLIIIGGEKRGINKEILNLCDEYLYIPYGSDFRNSLNASNALGVVSTLLFNQRKKND